ncbi:NADAR family protein [Deinococcus lacus]|uniref:NADAR family protein n=1 Tax=Deinococcus lacus TaxID=392561 RepID=A0ABW1YES4_9DEIO
MGRRVRGFDDAKWAEVREQVAFDAVWHKFRGNGKLRDFLLETGDLILVEASPTDRIWGIGYSESDAWDHRHQWGENLLGKALMQVREQLRKE